LLIVAVVAAVAAGGAAGVYAYMARSRDQSGPQAAVQPVAGKTLKSLPWTHTPEEPVADETEGVTDDESSDTAEQERDAKADESKSRTDRAANDGDPKKTTKQKRGKSGNKNANDESDNPVKRTQDELHRIREIFEGPP
jgi:hypothetical protein